MIKKVKGKYIKEIDVDVDELHMQRRTKKETVKVVTAELDKLKEGLSIIEAEIAEVIKLK